MGHKFSIVSTAIVTVILTSAFWVFAYNIAGAGNGGVHITRTPEARAGAVAVVKGPVLVAPSGLAIPVIGVRPDQLTDTFTAARSGGARTHDAIDIMAPDGTLVIAAAAGTVEKLYDSVGKGGITAYVRSPDAKWTFYYAHLQEYAAGLHEGQKVARGDPIGLVGHTGDASPDGPHLHFAINAMNPGERWWQGTPVNPYPVLAGKPAGR